MRILHVNARFGSRGGTESYLAQLIGDLAERGHHNEVACELLSEEVNGVVCHRMADLSSLTEPDAVTEREFRAIVAAAAPQVIHLHNTTNPRVVELASALVPSIRQVHDHTAFCPGLNKEYADGGLCHQPMGRHCLERHRGEGCLCLRLPSSGGAARRVLHTRRLLRAHRRLDRVLVFSSYMRDELVQVGVPPGLVLVNPPYAEPVTGSCSDETVPTVLMLGRLVHPDKGVLPLLEALAGIDAPFRAWLVGDGPDRSSLEAARDRMRLGDRVEFLGSLPHPQALARIEASRLVVLPSMWNEPFGLVGIEAMARGRPVVAFDVGGVKEWLEPDRTGILVPRGDVPALAGAIRTLLLDRSQAERLGRNGVEAVRRRFSAARHLGALEQEYRAARGQPRPML